MTLMTRRRSTLFLLALLLIPATFFFDIQGGRAETTIGIGEYAARYVGQAAMVQGRLVVRQNSGLAPECALLLESHEEVSLELSNGASCPILYSGVEVRAAGTWRIAKTGWLLAVDDYEIISPVQTTGSIEILVILIEFSDIQHDSAYSLEYFQDLLFSDSAGSMKSYYSEVAFGQVELTGVIAGNMWYTSANTMAFYGQDSEGCGGCDDENGPIYELAREAVQLADDDVDFSLYDGDGDGYVDNLAIVHAGEDQADTGVSEQIWSHRWAIQPSESVDGVDAFGYFLQAESSPMGTYAHEFGHDLGLPDLYDIDYEELFVGPWGLMAGGGRNGPGRDGSSPAHPVSWSKLKLGWVSPSHVYEVDPSVVNELTLVPLELNAESFGSSAIQVARIDVGTSYYFIEVRRQLGFDYYLPGEGVLISYVDESIGSGHGIVRVRDSNPGTSSLDDAAFQVGESFYDSVNGILIEITSTDGTSYSIRVSSESPPAVDDVDIISSTSYVNAAGELVVVAMVCNIGTEILTGITLYAAFYDAFDALLTTFPVTTMLNTVGPPGTAWACSPVVATYPTASEVSLWELEVNAAAYIEQTNYRGLALMVEGWTLDFVGGQPTLFTVWGDVTNTGGQDASYVKVIFSIHEDEPPGFILAAKQTYTTPRDIPSGGDAAFILEFSENLAGIQWFTWRFEVAPPTHFLEVSSPYGSPLGQRFYEEGSVATVSVQPIVDDGNGVRHVFVGWTGDVESTEPTITILMDGPKSVTALWKTQYLVEVDSQYGSPTGEGWYDEGSTATLYVDTIVGVGEGTRGVFTGWTGDVTSSDPSVSFTVDSPKTVVAEWRIQHFLTVEKSHSEGTVDTPSGWHDEGTALTMTAEETVNIVSGQTRLVFVGWTGAVSSSNPTIMVTMDEPKTLVASWKTQHFVEVDSQYGTPTGQGWHDEGSTATVSVEDTLPVSDGTRLKFAEWIGDLTSTSSTFSFTVDGPKSLSASWKTQHFVDVDSRYGTPIGRGWYDEGRLVTVSVEEIVSIAEGTRSIFTGWMGDLTGLEAFISFVVDSPKALIATWKTQHFVEVDSQYGTPTGQGWHDEGTMVTVSVDETVSIAGGTRVVFTGWTGDLTGSEATVSLLVDSPKTLAANWKLQHFLTIEKEPQEGVVSVSSDWFDEGTTLTVATEGILETAPGQTRLVFVGWTGAVSSSDPSIAVTMDAPKTLVATWKTQHFLEVNVSPSGIAEVTGEGWYDQGATPTTSSAQAVIEMGKTKYVFAFWTLDGVAQAGNPVSVVMDLSHRVMATYQTKHYLTVESELGDPQGEGWYDEDSTVTFSVTSPLGFLVQEVFAGWSGDSTSNSPTAAVIMDSSKTITATWRTDYIQLLILVGGVTAAAGAGALLLRQRRRAVQEPHPGFCMNCGAPVEAGQDFCGNCGKKPT